MTGVAGSVLLWVSAAAVVVLAYFLARFIQQLGRTAAEVERLSRSLNSDLLPRAERILDRLEGGLAELQAATEMARKVATTADRIGLTLGEIAIKVQETVTPILDAVAELAGPLQRGAAVLAGVKAGWGALRRPRREGPEQGQ